VRAARNHQILPPRPPGSFAIEWAFRGSHFLSPQLPTGARAAGQNAALDHGTGANALAIRTVTIWPAENPAPRATRPVSPSHLPLFQLVLSVLCSLRAPLHTSNGRAVCGQGLSAGCGNNQDFGRALARNELSSAPCVGNLCGEPDCRRELSLSRPFSLPGRRSADRFDAPAEETG